MDRIELIISEIPKIEQIRVLDGVPGKDGRDGNDGNTPVKDIDYFDGKEIELNKSQTHIQWRYVGSQNWTNLIQLEEIRGIKGNDGYTPIKGIDYFDGVKGDKGDKGDTGEAGYTPQRGVDYWTAEDIDSIAHDVIAIAGPVGDMNTALDGIIAIQNELLGGGAQ